MPAGVVVGVAVVGDAASQWVGIWLVFWLLPTLHSVLSSAHSTQILTNLWSSLCPRNPPQFFKTSS
jgi:hypothetical protein